jgi:hypothetical protein
MENICNIAIRPFCAESAIAAADPILLEFVAPFYFSTLLVFLLAIAADPIAIL